MTDWKTRRDGDRKRIRRLFLEPKKWMSNSSRLLCAIDGLTGGSCCGGPVCPALCRQGHMTQQYQRTKSWLAGMCPDQGPGASSASQQNIFILSSAASPMRAPHDCSKQDGGEPSAMKKQTHFEAELCVRSWPAQCDLQNLAGPRRFCKHLH